jgi:transcriptional antiterminator RfaH
MDDETGLSEIKWYAVHIRSNQEKKTAVFLEDRNVDFFLPTYTVQSKRSDRRITLNKPLFTGYLFVHIDVKSRDRIHVLEAPGTVRIVGFRDQIVPIPDEVIASLRILINFGADQVKPHPLVKVGRKVRVLTGSFRNAVGILHETKDRKPKLVVEVDFLGRGVSIPISPEQVEPILK